MRMVLLTSVILLSACSSGPNLGVNVGLSPSGVSVNPSVSGRVGGVGVAVTP